MVEDDIEFIIISQWFFTMSLNSICQAQDYCETLINKYDYYLDKTNNSKTRTLTWSDGYLITKQNDTIYGEILKLPDVVTLKKPLKMIMTRVIWV